MTLDAALSAAVLLFPVSEIGLLILRRARPGVARRADEGSIGLLWLVILGSVGVAMASQWIPGLRLPGPRWLLRGLALLFLISGLALRWVAIVTLGRFFTVDVVIQDGHALVDRGVYHYVRHPSYTGLLIAFAGLAIYFGNWISLFALTLPIGVAFLRRIRKEEAALLEGLGASYAEYCGRTKRLLPGLY
jgi:protein-S-isoprenylcysteine O-methyltransferase